MKKILFIVLTILLSVNFAVATSVEGEIRDFARREYPNDSRMQNYVYKKQIAAYNYLRTVRDQEVMDIASREYPYDYAMQNIHMINSLQQRDIWVLLAIWTLKESR